MTETSSSTDLVLSPPEPVTVVTSKQAGDAVNLDEATRTRLESTALSFVEGLVAAEPQSEAFGKKVDAVHAMGGTEIRAAASVSNRMLDRPVKALDGHDQTAKVATDLVNLRQTIEDLDPSRQNLLTPKKLFGLIPFGDKVRDYFDKYKSAQAHLDTIIQSLYRGQDELRRDNASIDQERVNLWDTMEKLREYTYMAQRVDDELETRAVALDATDPAKAKALREDVQFYVRQKTQDLLTQLAVSVQGYLALDLVRKNNIELIKGVDRATTTTISALRTAVIVAQALGNQKLVLDQIQALNTTTSNMIESTSELLRSQSAEIHEQASSATVEVDKLRNAFANVYATMDAIDTYKAAALGSMQQTIDVLNSEVGKAQEYIDRAGSPTEASAANELALPVGKV